MTGGKGSGPGRCVRFARPSDVPTMVSLLRDLFGQEADFTPDPDRQARGIRLILDDPSVGRILVCESEGQVVGMASLLFTVSTAEGGPAAWLEDMVVDPARRGAGIGRELLEAALELADFSGTSRITLLTDRSNGKAQAFYRRHGFRESAMIPMRRATGRRKSEDQGEGQAMEDTGREAELVSVDEAARELGTTPTRVLMMLRSKELVGTETGEGWRVSAPSLSCARAHGIDRREASGCASYCRSKCGCG